MTMVVITIFHLPAKHQRVLDMTKSSATQYQRAGPSLNARRICFALTALISVIYATALAQRPLYNWDLIPYVAVALIDAGEPSDGVREKTYAIVRRSVPA